jgi:hypothetical protein
VRIKMWLLEVFHSYIYFLRKSMQKDFLRKKTF